MTSRPAEGAPRPRGVHVTWLGHASVVLELGGARVVTDPLLRRRLGPLTRRHDVPLHAHVHDTDAVLLSHLHHDHADLPSLRRLGHMPVITDPDNALWLRRQGLDAPDVPRDDWVPLAPGVETRLVRADHDTRPMPHRRLRGAAERMYRSRMLLPRRPRRCSPRQIGCQQPMLDDACVVSQVIRYLAPSTLGVIATAESSVDRGY